MSLKIEFVELATRKGANVSALCRQFKISRETGHKWLKRYREHGYDGLEERSRRPRNTPLATAEELVIAVLEAREAHPRWGPPKLVVLLQRKYGDEVPSRATVARILQRFGKVRDRSLVGFSGHSHRPLSTCLPPRQWGARTHASGCTC